MSKTELEHRILELESMLCESEQFAAQMEVKCDRLREALETVRDCGLEPIDPAYRRIAAEALKESGQ